MNSEVRLTLDQAVAEVISTLEGLDLQLVPEQDRYQSITRHLNKAIRAIALEQEWSYFSSIENVGTVQANTRELGLRSSVRPRIMHDDAARLVHPSTKETVLWAYFLPRDALSKYNNRMGLWVSYTRGTLFFSRKFLPHEHGLEVHIPVMREPRQFRLPLQPLDPNEDLVSVPDEVREQYVDFDYPDLVVAKAAYFYAQTDALMQPRVQTLDADYKAMMYALIERDTRNTDSPYQNDWSMGISSSISGNSSFGLGRAIADERGFPHG